MKRYVDRYLYDCQYFKLFLRYVEYNSTQEYEYLMNICFHLQHPLIRAYFTCKSANQYLSTAIELIEMSKSLEKLCKIESVFSNKRKSTQPSCSHPIGIYIYLKKHSQCDCKYCLHDIVYKLKFIIFPIVMQNLKNTLIEQYFISLSTEQLRHINMPNVLINDIQCLKISLQMRYLKNVYCDCYICIIKDMRQCGCICCKNRYINQTKSRS